MGIGDFFKKLFSSEPPEVDYSGRRDRELRELWDRRDTLRDDARVELAAEMERRGIEPSEDEIEHDDVAETPEEWGDLPEVRDVVFDDNLLFARQRCGVFLQTESGHFVMVVPPLWNGGEELYEPQLPELPEGAELDGVIILNEQAIGWLPTRDVLKGADVSNIMALEADTPTARDPQGEGGPEAQTFDGWWTCGGLALRRIAPNTLQVVWPGMGTEALVGGPIPLDFLFGRPTTTFVVGSVETPGLREGFQELVDDVDGSSLPSLRHIIFLLENAGCSAFPWVTIFPRAGVSVQVEGARPFVWAPAHALSDAAFRGDDERIEAELEGLDPAYVMAVVQLLAAEGRLDRARQVAESALAQMDGGGTLHLALGLCQALAGEDEDAVASFEAAATHDPPDFLGHACAAVVHAWNRDFDAAVAALEALESADTKDSRAVSETERGGDIEAPGGFGMLELKEISREDPVDLLTVDGLRELEADPARADEVAERRPMPLLSRKLAAYSQALDEAGRHATAATVAGWAIDQNPYDVTAVGARARALAEDDRAEEALEWLGGIRETFPENRYLRLIRAELLFDLERYDEATALYEKLADEHDDWAAPRAQLVATYAMDDQLDDARQMFDELDEIGIDDETAFSLERLMDEARLRLGRPRV